MKPTRMSLRPENSDKSNVFRSYGASPFVEALAIQYTREECARFLLLFTDRIPVLVVMSATELRRLCLDMAVTRPSSRRSWKRPVDHDDRVPDCEWIIGLPAPPVLQRGRYSRIQRVQNRSASLWAWRHCWRP
ncbi:hypothetical protein EVAR_43527_1 [Eumeta japonica]|uniref:Uncharacterized protein n=1 Tax=Eumeta variegata TaxID=151549 RepID=A0A4C1W8X1_EUMVA|nr:hypothetical protein EVAR_43527_1 [Eumeta japonica]